MNWYPEGILGLLVLGIGVYIGFRALSAQRRGDDPAGAAADALRDVGPPALVFAGMLAFFVSVSGFLLVILFFVILSGDEGGMTAFTVVLYTMMVVALIGTGGSIAWAVRRARRRNR